MAVNPKDLAAGVLFVALGLGIGLYAFLTLDLGTVRRMGPGFFPLGLAAILFVIGLATMAASMRAEISPIGPVPWRGLALVLAAPIVFGATIRGLGFLPATVLTILISVFASRGTTLLRAAMITLGLTLFCVVVFVWGLRIPVRYFGPWLLG